MEGILVLIVVETQRGMLSFLTTWLTPVYPQSSLAWRDATCRRQSFWDWPGDPGVRQYKEAQAFISSSEITPSTLKQFWCFTHLPQEPRCCYLQKTKMCHCRHFLLLLLALWKIKISIWLHALPHRSIYHTWTQQICTSLSPVLDLKWFCNKKSLSLRDLSNRSQPPSSPPSRTGNNHHLQQRLKISWKVAGKGYLLMSTRGKR